MFYIKQIVAGLIETYRTRDVYELLDFLCIALIRKNLPKGQKGKFYRNEFGDEFIYIIPGLERYEERLIIAHELGHAILHTHLNATFYTTDNLFIKNKFEVQANKFAAELLINEDELDKSEIQDMSLEQLSSYFGVPKELLEYKFYCY